MEAAEPGARVRVLVVTNDAEIRAALEFGSPLDLDVTFCSDSRDASEELAGGVPSAVVVDLQTGNAGGFALARDMKADAALRNVPILMLLERPHDRWLAMKAGAADCVTKPVNAHMLVDRILQLLGA